MRFTVERDECSRQIVVRLYYYNTSGLQCVNQQVVNEEYVYNSTVDIISMVKMKIVKRMVSDIYEEVERNMSPNCTYSTTTATVNSFGDTNEGFLRHVWYDDTWSSSPVLAPSKIKLKLRVGKRILELNKEYNRSEVEITERDIEEAKVDYIRKAKIQIISNRAERRAEDLLRMFVSEVDFRNYKQKGYFSVRSGDKVFRIWRDNHKWIDMFQRENGVFVPKNRLCVHTPTRDVPLADEVVSKLLLIRSGRVIESANLHSCEGAERLSREEMELVGVN